MCVLRTYVNWTLNYLLHSLIALFYYIRQKTTVVAN